VGRANPAAAGLALIALVACGGEEPPPDTVPAANRARGAAVADTTGQADSLARTMELSREVFAYRGAGRDPFLSLLKSGAAKPLPGDVQVRGITFDPRYPQRSVATLQDTTDMRRYTVRVGDVIGRIRIAEIRANEVVAVVQEFGVDRQMVLPIRRRQEDTQ
jgi:hypothetical protein